MKQIQVLCINDFHAQLRETESTLGCAKYAAAMQQQLSDSPNPILVFGGDNYKGDPISEYSDGRPVTCLMKQLGTVVSAVGNHEMDYPMDTLAKWQAEGGYQFLAANLLDSKTGQIPNFARPYAIVERSGIRIAIIGLMTVENLNTSTHPSDIRGLEITDGTEAARKWTTFCVRVKIPAVRQMQSSP